MPDKSSPWVVGADSSLLTPASMSSDDAPPKALDSAALIAPGMRPNPSNALTMSSTILIALSRCTPKLTSTPSSELSARSSVPVPNRPRIASASPNVFASLTNQPIVILRRLTPSTMRSIGPAMLSAMPANSLPLNASFSLSPKLIVPTSAKAVAISSPGRDSAIPDVSPPTDTISVPIGN